MREILFRGKRLDNGEWVFGMLTGYGKKVAQIGTFCDYGTHICSISSLGVYPNTVGQFTGLTDKNGKRIFEGDIVRATIRRDEGYAENIRNEKGVIAFDSLGMIGLMLDRTGNNIPVWSDFFCELSLSGNILDYCFELIGNIHDNPELLERG